VPTCAACGQRNPGGFRFCGSCGAELGEWHAPREQRKTVTVLFCDVTGSTALGEQLDPESLRRTMGRYFEEIRRIVERHGGVVEKFIGDAVMAVFGIPLAHEDDALRAVRAAAEIRERIAVLGDELGVALSFRTGVNTGEVVAGEGETLVTGDAVNVAARLEQSAPPGEILIGGGTLALVRDAVVAEPVEPLDLKGKRERVAAHRLVSVDPTADAFVRHLDAPLIGRVRERERLRADFEAADSERACHLFTLLGPAGVGKSRLVAEFLAGVRDDADVLRARCLHYGEDITYWPLVEILLAIGAEPEPVIGSSPAETQLSFRKLLEARAEGRPQIVLLDDIQWAEEVFLDLVEHIADLSRDAPILLLCVARPELLEERPGWGGGKLNATTVLLEPLNAHDCESLFDELAGDLALAPAVRSRILAAADGNPLFLEEMVAMIAENGDQEEIVVPPTIQALLQARLDRLAADERDVIGRGSIEGQVFHRGVVQELAPETGRAEVPAHLLSLVRKEVIRPDRATFSDDEAFRFRHLLIRDAAYDALPKETRAELHERFADSLERRGDLVELDEIVGYHLEQAHANRAALDPRDPRLDALAQRGAARLEQAARGALGRGDVGAGERLLGRALQLLPHGDPRRLELRIEQQWTLRETGQLETARAAIDEVASMGDPRAQAWAGLLAIALAFATGEHRSEEVQPRLEELRAVMESLHDELGLAHAAWLQFGIHWSACRALDSIETLDRGIEHATRAGAAHLAQYLTAWQGAAMMFGPTPAGEVLRDTEEAFSSARGTLELATAQRRRGRMLACLGRFDEARAAAYAGMEASRDAGVLVEAGAASMGVAFVETRAGDTEAAERVLRAGVAELEALGERGFLSTVICGLAEILVDRGELDEAAGWCHKARETTGPSDLATLAHVDAVEGLLTALKGDCAGGERLARLAVDLVAQSDFYDQAAGRRLSLARTLVVCGKSEEASAWATEALEIYEAKDDRPAAAWAQELLATLH
jgi:class 3 adenylate cyclase/tetratricopeptide (TPR) repeat protein